MSNQRLYQEFAKLFESACEELFKGFSCDINRIEANEFNAHEEPYARIDAGCTDFEIEIYLCLPYPALIMTHPQQGLHNILPESELEDWLCEMSNVLMGKLKRLLLAQGFTLTLGLPEFSLGYPLDARQYNSDERIKMLFETDYQVFEAGITIEFLTDNVKFNPTNQTENAISTGIIEFF